MGVQDVLDSAGCQVLNRWLASRSYVSGFYPSQADVACFKALSNAPNVEQYPHAARWYRHLSSFEPEFAGLSGDSTKPYSAYGPYDNHSESHNVNAISNATVAEADEEDLFGSDDESEDEEAKKVKEANLAAYKKKKEGKVKPAAKSIVTLDVKPWDDETDMKSLEANMRDITIDGLTWGASKLVPVGYGISKLQVNLVVEDEKVSIDDLQAQIEGDEDHVQSTDVAAMQKL